MRLPQIASALSAVVSSSDLAAVLEQEGYYEYEQTQELDEGQTEHHGALDLRLSFGVAADGFYSLTYRVTETETRSEQSVHL